MRGKFLLIILNIFILTSCEIDKKDMGCKSDEDCLSDKYCFKGECKKDEKLCIFVLRENFCYIEDKCYYKGENKQGNKCQICNPFESDLKWSEKKCEEGEKCNPETGKCEYFKDIIDIEVKDIIELEKFDIEEEEISEKYEEIEVKKKFGDSCEGDNECESDFCVERDEGKVCTEECEKTCANDWKCEFVEEKGGFYCLPEVIKGCKDTKYLNCFCVIGDDCILKGSRNPLNDCEECNPKENKEGWTKLPDGTICNYDSNGCTLDDYCENGKCVKGKGIDCDYLDDECNIGVCISTGENT